MEKMIEFKDEEMQAVIYKSMEMYENIKNSAMKVGNKEVDADDKRYLALLLGILNTNNRVGNVLTLMKYDYGMSVVPGYKSNQECNKIYRNHFCKLFDENNIKEETKVEDLMFFLLENRMIQRLHHSMGMSIICIKLIMHNLKENTKKELQKKKVLKFK